MVRTRTLRFLTLFKSLMVSLFTSTLVFGLYYPPGNICYTYTSLLTCESTPSLIVPGISECGWDATHSHCSLRPPPTDFAFTVTVAIVTSLISLPIDLSFLFTLTFICARRPILERIGLDSFTWLGTEPIDIEEYNEAVMPARFESMGQSREVVQLFTTAEREEHEISYVLRVLRHYETVMDDTPNPIIEDIMGMMGITFKDDDLHMSWLKSLRFGGNLRACVAHYLHKSRLEAFNIISNLDKFSPDEVELRESYLVQNFVVEQFSLLPKYALTRHFFQFLRNVPKHIHPIPWFLGWVYVIGSIVFILYYVLAWGATNDGISLSSWGTNFALETLHACFVNSTIRLFVINVFAVELLRPQLVKLYNNTLMIATEVFKDTEFDGFRDGSQLVQLFSPACIASRWVHCKNLLVAKVLRSLTDEDLLQIEDIQSRIDLEKNISMRGNANNSMKAGARHSGELRYGMSSDSDYEFRVDRPSSLKCGSVTAIDLRITLDAQDAAGDARERPVVVHLPSRDSDIEQPSSPEKRGSGSIGRAPSSRRRLSRLGSTRNRFSHVDFGF